MKNLTKTQLYALTDKIYSEIVSSIKEYNDSLVTEEGLKDWKNKNAELVKTIVKTIEGCKLWYRYEADYNIERIKETDPEKVFMRMYKQTLEPVKLPRKQSIEQDIVLRTIESNNLDDIIEKIKSKYTIN